MSGIQIESLSRVCVICKKEKDLSSYYLYSNGKPMARCKECHKENQQNFRKENKSHYKIQSNLRYEKAKLRAIEYKGSSCMDCGGIFPPYVYDFHHINPEEKDPSWTLGRGWDYLTKELDKCILLCANCHRVRHFGIMQEEGVKYSDRKKNVLHR